MGVKSEHVIMSMLLSKTEPANLCIDVLLAVTKKTLIKLHKPILTPASKDMGKEVSDT